LHTHASIPPALVSISAVHLTLFPIKGRRLRSGGKKSYTSDIPIDSTNQCGRDNFGCLKLVTASNTTVPRLRSW